MVWPGAFAVLLAIGRKRLTRLDGGKIDGNVVGGLLLHCDHRTPDITVGVESLYTLSNGRSFAESRHPEADDLAGNV